jgi:signal transduction histidine kinase
MARTPQSKEPKAAREKIPEAAPVLPAIERQVRFGALFLGVATLILLSRETRLETMWQEEIMATYAVRFVLYFGAALWLGKPRGEITTSIVALLGIAVFSFTSALLVPMADDRAPHLVVSVGVALASAALIPWHVGWQFLSVAVLSAGLFIDSPFDTLGPPGPINDETMLAYATCMAGSVFVCMWFGWQRSATAAAVNKALTDTRRAENELRSLNQKLESRVQQSASDTARAQFDLEAAHRRLDASHRSLEEAFGELEGFTHSASHDLRDPLRVIAGLSDLAREEYGDVLDEAGRGYLSRIKDAAIRVTAVVDDLVTLARITRAPLKPQEVDLTLLAGDAAAACRKREPQRSVDLVISPRMTVRGDWKLLSTVMEQLMANAWKFTRGREHAEVVVGPVSFGGQSGFFVRDNGSGFDPEFGEKLFGRFERLHDDPNLEGRGIGLAIVGRIVARHGGTIRAEGQKGIGATFYVFLP